VTKLKQPRKPQHDNQISGTETEQVNVARAAIYSFLSRAFKVEVDQRFLDSIVAVEPTIKSLGSSESGREFQEGSRELFEFTNHVKGLDEEQKGRLLTDLAVEYARLFLGMGDKHVYLSESVYVGKDHLLYGEPFHEVIQAYKSLGFEKEKDFREPEDHVAVEFEFMARLCQWTAQTLKKQDVENTLTYLSLQKEFLTDHIMRWVPELCKSLDGAAPKGFYKALGHLTLGFITIDNQIPDHMTETLRDPSSSTK
jgi:TorA maturation chaperone TorD